MTTEYVSELIPEVGRSKAVTVQGTFRYHAYVTGSYLDQVADDERTGLKFALDVERADPSQDGDSSGAELFSGQDVTAASSDGITKKELLDRVTELVRIHLSDTITEIRLTKEKKIDAFAAGEQPQFRPFAERAKKSVDKLPVRPTNRDIELVLYEAKIDGRVEMQRLVNQIVADHPSVGQVAAHRKQLTDQFVTEANRHNQSALAEYVCTRKAVIQVLKANLGKDRNDEHAFEKAIHDLFFPRTYTSDRLPAGPVDPGEVEIENLWLIDERLVFHRLLSSDLPLSTLHGFLTDGVGKKDDEPDIVIFDPAFITGIGEDIQSAAIVEFKRPGRTDYGEQRNPIKQIIDAAKTIRSGSIEGRGGEVQAIRQDLLIFGYAICDMTDPLKRLVENTYDMRLTPDRLGYYKYHEHLNLLIELIPYSKLIQDAERRNAGFFKKLGLS